MSSRITRPSTQVAHPGLPDKPAPRRSSAQVKVDSEVAAASKRIVDKERQDKLKKIRIFKARARALAAQTEKEVTQPLASIATKQPRPLVRMKDLIDYDFGLLDADQVLGEEPDEDVEMVPTEVEESEREDEDEDGDGEMGKGKERGISHSEGAAYQLGRKELLAVITAEIRTKKAKLEVGVVHDKKKHGDGKRKAAAGSMGHSSNKKAKVQPPSGLVRGWRKNIPEDINEKDFIEVKSSSEDEIQDKRQVIPHRSKRPALRPVSRRPISTALAPTIPTSTGTTHVINAKLALADIFAEGTPYDSDTSSMFENGGLQDENDAVEGADLKAGVKTKSCELTEVIAAAIGPEEQEGKKHVGGSILHKEKDKMRVFKLEDDKAIAAPMLLKKGIAGITPEQKRVSGKLKSSSDASNSLSSTQSQPQSELKWHLVFMPMWLDYMGTLHEPWDTEIVAGAQALWDHVFPSIPRVLALKGEPIFGVCTQRIYEWHRNFALDGVDAVKRFFSSNEELLPTVADKAAFVAYAAPQGDEASVVPFLWGSIDMDPTTRNEAHIGVSVMTIPLADRDTAPPIGAVALATCSAERALQLWSSGVFVQPASNEKFSNGVWGIKTEQYVRSLRDKSNVSWRKLVANAEALMALEFPGSGRPARAACVDIESEPETFD
ncbi:hypothetical protein EW146_g9371 [Bondarzewia mesenterica]|uniref:Uncharacterized protein n=1 Tax=Bondarzewia mesenterica TaxID=1095465 RepID=A0A4S4L6V3_9AGAM|nr:hypothetical protein EW146_g9371 [Bondarzewia mesenterica]